GEHASQALAAGGVTFPEPVKKAMSLVARAMTSSSYRL
ncbi:MAG TPA: demethoxyubiquinone hydroxylase family protein, partial [Porticoccaceae bacterium]|nr:demethoxyubiquinone hydroxylase family protein [Porticoccaceae bacterium]